MLQPEPPTCLATDELQQAACRAHAPGWRTSGWRTPSVALPDEAVISRSPRSRDPLPRLLDSGNVAGSPFAGGSCFHPRGRARYRRSLYLRHDTGQGCPSASTVRSRPGARAARHAMTNTVTTSAFVRRRELGTNRRRGCIGESSDRDLESGVRRMEGAPFRLTRPTSSCARCC